MGSLLSVFRRNALLRKNCKEGKETLRYIHRAQLKATSVKGRGTLITFLRCFLSINRAIIAEKQMYVHTQDKESGTRRYLPLSCPRRPLEVRNEFQGSGMRLKGSAGRVVLRKTKRRDFQFRSVYAQEQKTPFQRLDVEDYIFYAYISKTIPE